MKESRRPKGFSFVEILISIILVGLSITALVVASNSFTQANGTGADISTAEFLIEQIRELTTLLPMLDPAITAATWTTLGSDAGETLATYDDVDDFDGFNSAALGAPIDAGRNPLNDLAAFTQSVTVERVSRLDFSQVVADSATSPFIRVTVRIDLSGREISSASWIRALY
jgi:type II secretory pathway pseudopilin PulG